MSRTGALLLVVLLLGSAAAHAQSAGGEVDSAKQAIIHRLLTLQRADSLMVSMAERSLAAQAATPGIPEGYLDAFIAKMRENVGSFLDRLVPLYDSLYSMDDLRGMQAFYESPVGQRFLATQPRLVESTMLLGQQWGLELAGQVLVDLSRKPVTKPEEP